MFRNHPLFSRDPTALQLFLYYDEVELANPLGSKTGKHKLGRKCDILVFKIVRNVLWKLHFVVIDMHFISNYRIQFCLLLF